MRAITILSLSLLMICAAKFYLNVHARYFWSRPFYLAIQPEFQLIGNPKRLRRSEYRSAPHRKSQQARALSRYNHIQREMPSLKETESKTKACFPRKILKIAVFWVYKSIWSLKYKDEFFLDPASIIIAPIYFSHFLTFSLQYSHCCWELRQNAADYGHNKLYTSILNGRFS